MDFAKSANIAQRLWHDAAERKITQCEVALRFRKVTQITRANPVPTIRDELGHAHHRNAPLRLNVGLILAVRDKTYASVIPDILGVFRQTANEDDQTAIVIH